MSKAWGRRWFVQRQGMRSILSRNTSIPCTIPLPPSPNKKKILNALKDNDRNFINKVANLFTFSISKVKHSDHTVRIIFQLNKKISYSLSTSYSNIAMIFFQKEKIHPKPANKVYNIGIVDMSDNQQEWIQNMLH